MSCRADCWRTGALWPHGFRPRGKRCIPAPSSVALNLRVVLIAAQGKIRPQRGAHTDAVVREAGYSAEEVAALRRDGVV